MSRPIVRLERYAKHPTHRLSDGSVVGGASTMCKYGLSVEGLLRWSNNQGLLGNDIIESRGKSADYGTIAHFLIACHLEGHEPDLREFTEEEIEISTARYEQAIAFLEREELSAVAVEVQLASDIYSYGGIVDLVATDKDGKPVLIDWKSSKKIMSSHYLQASGYEMLWNENDPRSIERRAVVLMHDTKVKPHWVTDSDIERYKNVFRVQALLHKTMKDNKVS